MGRNGAIGDMEGSEREITGSVRWGVQYAKRKSRKGRAIGGMVMGIKEELMGKEEETVEKGEGLIVGKASLGRRRWRIVGVYVNGDMDNKLDRMKRCLEEGG